MTYAKGRYYDMELALFSQVDPPLANGTYLSGEPNDGVFNMNTLAAYTYVENRPVVATDPTGNVTVFGHGTDAFSQTWSFPDKRRIQKAIGDTNTSGGHRASVESLWHGSTDGYKDIAREYVSTKKGVSAIYNDINAIYEASVSGTDNSKGKDTWDDKLKSGEKVNFVGYSHGGNMTIGAIAQVINEGGDKAEWLKENIGAIVTVSSPFRQELEEDYETVANWCKENDVKWTNVYNKHDKIQYGSHRGRGTSRGDSDRGLHEYDINNLDFPWWPNPTEFRCRISVGDCLALVFK